ncbi:nitroreductase family protein [uncultured Draconibacterium sp.]|uniref:nitroreductase family protein n=1 Tax=uncultured Draconibacterium sp. TaxID=1573823 RepID=UPI002AA60F0F|nr:nitroreductase family protein [uncultured Draconibacterium sp.]
MIDFKIDKEKCTQCGLCAADCPTLVINPKSEYPEIKEGKEAQCIKCQHCLAICPTAALSIWGKKPENSIPVKKNIVEPEALAQLVKTRRSIRKFKPEELEKEFIHELLATAAYAPTGHNKNQVLFSVVDNRSDLEKFREAAYSGIKTAFDAGNLPASMAFLNDFQRLWYSKQIDVVFRNAPHLLIASAPKAIATPETDATIALSYFELLANSNGLGTLWNGFVKWIIRDIVPELGSKIGLPDDHVIAGVLLFGKPAVKYARSIQSEGLHLNRISF